MTTATPRLLRRINAQRVLDVLRDGGPARVTEVVERTGLSRPTVDAVADDLIRLGRLAEIAPEGARRGRPARSLAFRADAGYVAGVDVGEHKVRVALADLAGEIVAEDVHLLDGGDPLPETRLAVAHVLKVAGVRREQLLSACVGCTGPMDPETGRVIFSSLFENGFDLAGALRRTLGPRVVVENDCNLAVIGERWQGAAVGVADVICMLGGERIGAGIVVGGALLRGHAGVAGELAFLGEYGEVEGAQGVAQLMRQLAGRPADEVVAAAGAGDPDALAIVERAAHWAGLAIVTMAQVVNPELVVIAGGVAAAGEILLEPLRRELATIRMPPRLEASPLGARVVIVGAVRRALDDLEPRLLDGLEDAA